MQCLLYAETSHVVSIYFYQDMNYENLIHAFQYCFFCLYSEKSEDKESKKRKVCRCGAGVEATPNMCDTPGFPLRVVPKLVHNLRGFDRLELPRNDRKIVATSRWLVQGWRANCDIQVLLYECNPLQPNHD